MAEYIITRCDDQTLQHYGVKGQKWGIRRYQNEDGTLTDKGIKRYNKIKDWEKSKSGKVEIDKFAKQGLSKAEAYEVHRASKAGAIGFLAAGIIGTAVGVVVSSNRSKAGREFTEKVISGEIMLDSNS